MNDKISPHRQVEKRAMEVVREWHLNKKDVELCPPTKGELGFDFKYPDSSCYVEVKGVTEGTTMAFPGRTLTEQEFTRVKECAKDGKKYDLFVVFGVGSEKETIRIFHRDEILRIAKPEISYRIPFRRKEIEKHKPE